MKMNEGRRTGKVVVSEKINKALAAVRSCIDPKLANGGAAELILTALEKEIPQKPLRREAGRTREKIR